MNGALRWFGLVRWSEIKSLEDKFNDLLRKELEKSELRVDETIATITQIDVEPRTGQQVVVRIRIPHAFADRLAKGGEVADMVKFRVSQMVTQAFVEAGQPDVKNIDLGQGPDGAYL